ncbi:ATP synthase F1 subunit delta [Salinimicrobium sediminilitoris]|uniref:ATP synthase F1 subunit delta n=1 Tax=Salinimicrobium sediminilitoris TaxID=2876715 RepID=UPI001E4C55E6|nr:ATP synthase F1 subunit delta [Salinimicrobium sediminilitoris]MCC8359577.1 ATP synthase F1 subunit delta [Salinimicrobium sediminilitoris]
MQGSRAAARYAKALLSLAKDKNVAKEVNDDMTTISETIANSSDLRNFLKNPVIKNNMKKSALLEIFRSVNGVTSGLFAILIENNRLDILPLVAKNYNRLFNEMNGVQVARVTTAIPLTPALEAKIQQKVKELTGNEAKIENIIDESIIGGFILRVGDIQYNGSVSAQLTNLKRELLNNTYVTKI